MKYNIFLPLTLVAAMSGCVTDSSALNEKAEGLAWLKKADATMDAEKAIANGDFRLMGIPLRHTVIPGIEVKMSRQYALKCGVNLMQGISDTVRSEKDIELSQKAYQYAEDYNAVVKKHCKP